VKQLEDDYVSFTAMSCFFLPDKLYAYRCKRVKVTANGIVRVSDTFFETQCKPIFGYLRDGSSSSTAAVGLSADCSPKPLQTTGSLLPLQYALVYSPQPTDEHVHEYSHANNGDAIASGEVIILYERNFSLK